MTPADPARNGTYVPPTDPDIAAAERLVFDFGMASVRAAHHSAAMVPGEAASPEQRAALKAASTEAWAARMAVYDAFRAIIERLRATLAAVTAERDAANAAVDAATTAIHGEVAWGLATGRQTPMDAGVRIVEAETARDAARALALEACDVATEAATTVRGEDIDPDGERADEYIARVEAIRTALADSSPNPGGGGGT